MIPACRTIDAVSIFALTVDDAWGIAQIMQGFDEKDAYSRQHPANVPTQFSKAKIAIPAQLEFYGDIESEKAFQLAVQRVQSLGYQVEKIDFTVFQQLASALYNKAWVAERTSAVENRIQRDQAHPVIQQIIAQADQFSAVDLIEAEYERADLARQIQLALVPYDALMVPTSPTIYKITDVEADPIAKNSHMGTYTNFVNFADLAALALPNAIRTDGLPTGITFIAPAWHDQALAHFGQPQQNIELNLGSSDIQYSNTNTIESQDSVKLAVVGAHLLGMPLNFQLTTRGATFIQKTKTAPSYCLYALKNTTPPKPGLQFNIKGKSIEVEVWDIPFANFGQIVAEVPAPLGIGNVQLLDGTWVKGFICEGYALDDATDVTLFGGWRDYIKSKEQTNTTFEFNGLGEIAQ